MNTKLLRKVQKAIVGHAPHFDMSEWGRNVQRQDLMHDEPETAECGTTACIAGFACAIADGRVSPLPWERAKELLELEEDESERLFFASNWPIQFYRRFNRALRQTTQARIAADRIEHFIKTKGME